MSVPDVSYPGSVPLFCHLLLPLKFCWGENLPLPMSCLEFSFIFVLLTPTLWKWLWNLWARPQLVMSLHWPWTPGRWSCLPRLVLLTGFYLSCCFSSSNSVLFFSSLDFKFLRTFNYWEDKGEETYFCQKWNYDEIMVSFLSVAWHPQGMVGCPSPIPLYPHIWFFLWPVVPSCIPSPLPKFSPASYFDLHWVSGRFFDLKKKPGYLTKDMFFKKRLSIFLAVLGLYCTQVF